MVNNVIRVTKSGTKVRCEVNADQILYIIDDSRIPNDVSGKQDATVIVFAGGISLSVAHSFDEISKWLDELFERRRADHEQEALDGRKSAPGLESLRLDASKPIEDVVNDEEDPFDLHTERSRRSSLSMREAANAASRKRTEDDLRREGGKD